MGKSNPTAITLDGSAVTEWLEILEYVDAEITTFKGTWAEKVKAAEAEVNSYALDTEATTAALDSLASAATVEDFRTELAAIVAASDEYVSAATTELLKSRGGSEKFDSLVEKRKEIVAGIEQVATVLVQFGVLEAMPTIPSAPAGLKSSGSGRPRGVKVSGAQYYTIIGGKERAPADSQNTLSSIAYYRGADLLDCLEENKGKHNVPASQLLQAIENAGGDPKASTPWQVTLPGGVIGMRVVDAPTED